MFLDHMLLFFQVISILFQFLWEGQELELQSYSYLKQYFRSSQGIQSIKLIF